jgi:hypothetical protein
MEQDFGREIAYRKAIAAIKSVKTTVTNVN